jgi:hypothetical protein
MEIGLTIFFFTSVLKPPPGSCVSCPAINPCPLPGTLLIDTFSLRFASMLVEYDVMTAFELDSLGFGLEPEEGI